MEKPNTIQVYEHSVLKVGKHSSGEKTVMFTEPHWELLSKYHAENSGCPYFEPSYKRIIFKNYVGVIKLGNLTIEILPKTDRHRDLEERDWQKILIDMLLISLSVEAQTTTVSSIHIRQHTVLETYLGLFLEETEKLWHQGLVKKYRTEVGNQTALKGKLMLQGHITKNPFHAERFYVAHTVYDRDNVFNSVLRQALCCIARIAQSGGVLNKADALLLDFPECNEVLISEKLFTNLVYNRKTESYRKAMELARIILLNYHPDIKNGQNDILAIMFDMNLLWERYVLYILQRASSKSGLSQSIKIIGQGQKKYWKPEQGYSKSLKPDIVVKIGEDRHIVIDTKWKYKSAVSVDDIRQMYAYGDYFHADECYLLYPDKLENTTPVTVKNGKFHNATGEGALLAKSCGLMFIDLVSENKLNKHIGKMLLEKLVKIDS